MQQQLGKDKVPSVVLPPSLKSFEGVDLLVKTNTMGTQHSSKSIANSDPSTPTYSGHLNSTPDSEKKLSHYLLPCNNLWTILSSDSQSSVLAEDGMSILASGYVLLSLLLMMIILAT
jgi:hypothetical protein